MTSIDSDIIQQQGITFRAGVPSDLEAITRVFLAGLDTMLPDRRWGEERYVWERDMAEGGSLRLRSEKMLRDELVRLAVTVRGGEETVLAFVSFVLASTREDRRGKITNLFVHPDAHGLHIGPTLISWVQERVRADALSSRQEGEQATAAVWLKFALAMPRVFASITARDSSIRGRVPSTIFHIQRRRKI
ncbi:hypothetical protein BKA62DRAFT_232214 [Auriculariales sp. MPI-PUGE-AT-0066]|nr:hypothetical protein BKA62DRAFT_232214 [Auriculariales sp. MPI-PUGE-AT-0066]